MNFSWLHNLRRAAQLIRVVGLASLALGCQHSKSNDTGGSCGDGVLQQDEDCEATAAPVGLHGCATGSLCGDGVLDNDEDCDDGNRESGDGCSPQCQLEDVCGDGRVDPGEECDGSDADHGVTCTPACILVRACGDGILDPGEQCDDGNTTDGDGCDSQCVSEIGPAVCGNGVWEPGEQCDDGNTERYDDCHECAHQQSLYITRMWVEPGDIGSDFVGAAGILGDWDCRVDNRLGQLANIRGALTAGLDYAIATDYALLLTLDNLADPRGQQADDVRLYMYSGDDVDGNLSTSRRGGDSYYVRVAGLKPDGSPDTVLTGGVRGSRLDVTSDFMTLDVTQGPFVVPWAMTQARLTGTLVTDGRRVTRVQDGRFTGVLDALSIAQFPAEYTEQLALFANVDPLLYAGFLDILVLGVLEHGASEPFQPDVDLDGDGLETFYDTDPHDGRSVINLCIDGDGTAIPGESCVSDPRIRDGFSFTFAFDAVWVQLIGVKVD